MNDPLFLFVLDYILYRLKCIFDTLTFKKLLFWLQQKSHFFKEVKTPNFANLGVIVPLSLLYMIGSYFLFFWII
jgi:hypothetical protein